MKSLKFKVFLSLLTLSISGLMLFGWIQKELARQNLINQFDDRMERFGLHLMARAGLKIKGHQVEESFARQMGVEMAEQVFFRLESSQDELLYTSKKWPDQMKISHWSQSGKEMDPQPDFGDGYIPGGQLEKEKRPYKKVDTPISSFVFHGNQKYYGIHFRNADVHLVVTILTEDLWASLNAFDASLLMASLATFLVMALLSIWIAHQVLRPISRLGSMMEGIQGHEGDVNKLPASIEIEFEPIKASFLDMYERLQKQYLSTQRFNADVSHELKTPLAILKMGLERALKNSEEAQKENLVHCLEECEMMQSMLQKLFLLAQADQHGLKGQFKTVDFNLWLMPFIEDAELLGEEQGLEVTFEGLEQEAVTELDEALMRTCIYNLIQNAIRYNRPNGQVVLTLSVQDETLSLEIENTGQGFNADQKEHIFDRFQRGSHNHQGLGLGLALVKEIISIHHGRVYLKSSEEDKTCFVLHLPLKKEK